MSRPLDAISERALSRVGSTLNGKYRLEHLLGVGGMAAVYRAIHRNGNRVAVKMLHLELSLDREIHARFLREGYAANNLEHPGVVRVLDDDTAEDGSAFLVMELLEGETLDARARSAGGTLSHREVLSVAWQVLDVLSAARRRGVVHRDIKPENLFLSSFGVVKVLDFGIARMQSASARATKSGEVFGTPAFMPPEQARGLTSEVDHQSDLWALGATMYTLLSGRFVHDAQSSTEQLLAAAYQPAPSLAACRPDLPASLVALVDQALCVDKKARWLDAETMKRSVEHVCTALYGTSPATEIGELRAAIERTQIRAPAAFDAPGLTGPGSRFPRKNALAIAVAAGLLALTAVLVLLLVRNPRRVETSPALELSFHAVPSATASVAAEPGFQDAAALDAPQGLSPPAPAQIVSGKSIPPPPRKKPPPARSAFDYQ